MANTEQDELKEIYQKVMIGAVTLLVAIFGYFGKSLVNEIEQMNDKLDTIIEQVIENKKDIEYLKRHK